jgi:hypothetical protein
MNNQISEEQLRTIYKGMSMKDLIRSQTYLTEAMAYAYVAMTKKEAD